MGEGDIAEEVVLGLGKGFLYGVELGLEVGLVRVGGGVEELVGCGGECGGDGYGGGEFLHGRLLGVGWGLGVLLVGIFGESAWVIWADVRFPRRTRVAARPGRLSGFRN